MKKEQISTLVDQLDTLLGHMDDCTKLLQHFSAPYQTTEKLYAPQSMRLIQWEWALKSGQLMGLIDDTTAEYRLSTDQLLSAAEGMQDATEGILLIYAVIV